MTADSVEAERRHNARMARLRALSGEAGDLGWQGHEQTLELDWLATRHLGPWSVPRAEIAPGSVDGWAPVPVSCPWPDPHPDALIHVPGERRHCVCGPCKAIRLRVRGQRAANAVARSVRAHAKGSPVSSCLCKRCEKVRVQQEWEEVHAWRHIVDG